ncbi:MAG: hypothetical protein RhofKO_18840 [Rhodothermales bacterium]
MQLLSSLILSLFLISASGCDSNGSDDPDDFAGTYEATVSGAISQDYSGVSWFGASAQGQQTVDGFGVGMGASVMTTNPVFSIASTQRPSEGTFSLGQTLDGGSLVATFSAGGAQVYISTSGTLRITRSTNDRLEGTFEFTATNPLPGAGTVTVSGEFKAKGTDIGSQ